jgi:hypothetical protein
MRSVIYASALLIVLAFGELPDDVLPWAILIFIPLFLVDVGEALKR